MKRIILQNLKVAFFFFAFLFIVSVGTQFLFNKFNPETLSSAALTSTVITIVFSLLMGLYQYISIKKNKISLADFSISPKQSASFIVDKDIAETQEIIENILPYKLNSCKFSYNTENEIFNTKTRATMRSWGEIIAIKLTPIGSKTQLSVFSRPVLKTTLIDYGKSSLNIKKIRAAFEQNGL